MASPVLVPAGARDGVPVFVVGSLLLVTAGVGGAMVGSGGIVLLLAPVSVLAVLAMVRWPSLIPLGLLASALLIEQYAVPVGSSPGAFTAKIPLFRTVAAGTFVLPVEAVLVVGLLIWAMRGTLAGSVRVPRGAVAKALLGFWLLLAVGFGVGMSRGGQFNIALWELRPWLLLSLTFLLAYAFLTTRRLVEAVLWVIVLGTGFKALQGVQIYFSVARSMNPRPEAILGHEESLFFGISLILTLALWVYKQRGPLRTVATALMPFVLVADLANARRVAWPILLIGVVMLLAITWGTRPDQRRVVTPILVVLSIGCLVYFPLYWNKTGGTLAQPARAVRSTVSPDPRDLASNLYREQEDANLKLNIQQSGWLGKGFGTPINYALPIVDVRAFDSMIAYIPHNGVLWVWMRLGLQGEIALWILIGTAVIGATRLARASDPLYGLVGAVTACAVLGYILQGYEDLGFASVRIAAAFGCLLGCVEAASRLAAEGRAENEARDEADSDAGVPA